MPVDSSQNIDSDCQWGSLAARRGTLYYRLPAVGGPNVAAASGGSLAARREALYCRLQPQYRRQPTVGGLEVLEG